MEGNVDFNFLRETGNHLMAEFTTLVYLMNKVITCSTEDINTSGEASITVGETKYRTLTEIVGMIDGVKRDYLFFSEMLYFPAGDTDWSFPFDESFRDVDVNMDCQAVDRFFDSNFKIAYGKVLKCKATAEKVFLELMGRTIFYPCPCCKKTYFEKNGDFNICPVCDWENDKTQNEDPTFAGGANKESLRDAIAAYCRRMGI